MEFGSLVAFHDCIRNLPFWLKLELEPKMAIFQHQGAGGEVLQQETEALILSFLFEQEKIPALCVSKFAWTEYSTLARELARDWNSFVRFQEDRRYELWLANVPEEDWPECWSLDRDWAPAAASWQMWGARRCPVESPSTPSS